MCVCVCVCVCVFGCLMVWALPDSFFFFHFYYYFFLFWLTGEEAKDEPAKKVAYKLDPSDRELIKSDNANQKLWSTLLADEKKV